MAAVVLIFFSKILLADLDSKVTYFTANSYKIRIGDLNNDGLLDVVGAGSNANNVDVFLQNMEGSLNTPIIYPVSYGVGGDLDVGDINNDGLVDIIVASGTGFDPNIGVLTQKSDGSFNPAAYYDLGGNELIDGAAVGDVNGDGLKDIVVTYGGNWPNSRIGVFLQNTSGTLNPAISYESYDIPGPVEVADVNNDGKEDIIVTHRGWYEAGVYLQGIDGQLMPEEFYRISDSQYNPQGLAVGDISNDGLNDIVIADYNAGLGVLYHRAYKAKIFATPSPVKFDVTLGDTSYQTMFFYNMGAANLEFGDIKLSGMDITQFDIQNDNCSGQSVPPWDFCTFNVIFTPTSAGSKGHI